MNEPYIIHDLMGYPHHHSLGRLGELVFSDLVSMQSCFYRTQLDISMRTNSLRYGTISNQECTAVFDLIVRTYFYKLEAYRLHRFAVSSFDIGQHNDISEHHSRAQVMFILNNPDQLVLRSWNVDGMLTTHVPEPGEILMLDTWCEHDLIGTKADRPLDFCGLTVRM